MKKILIICVIIATVVAVSCRRHPDVYGGKTPDQIRILYWNVQNGMWGDELNDYDNFVAFVQRVNPDICVWCEAATIYKPGSDEYLPEKNGYHYSDDLFPNHWPVVARRYGHKYTFRGYRRNDYPQQITAKYPIVKKWQSVNSEVYKDSLINDGSTLFEVDLYNGYTIQINPCHLWQKEWAYAADGNIQQQEISIIEHGGDKQRKRQMEYIMKHAPEDYPDFLHKNLWVVAGDMNSLSPVDYPGRDPEDPVFMTHNYLRKESGLVDALKIFHPEFCDTHVNGNRIDYVYVSPFAAERLLDCHVETEDPFVKNLEPSGVDKFRIPSDHRPIILDIKIK